MAETEPTKTGDLSRRTQAGVFLGLTVPVVVGTVLIGTNMDTLRGVYHDLTKPSAGPAQSESELQKPVRAVVLHAGRLVLETSSPRMMPGPDGERLTASRRSTGSNESVTVVIRLEQDALPTSDDVTDVLVKVRDQDHKLKQAFVITSGESDPSGEATWSITERTDGVGVLEERFEMPAAAADLEFVLQSAFPET